MQIIIKLLFVLIATAGIVAVYYLSWFWRIFIIPIVILLLWDVVSSLVKKKD